MLPVGVELIPGCQGVASFTKLVVELFFYKGGLLRYSPLRRKRLPLINHNYANLWGGIRQNTERKILPFCTQRQLWRKILPLGIKAGLA